MLVTTSIDVEETEKIVGRQLMRKKEHEQVSKRILKEARVGWILNTLTLRFFRKASVPYGRNNVAERVESGLKWEWSARPRDWG